MQIRQKLTYQFVTIVAIILMLFSVSVYYFSANYREDILYDRLKNRAISVASLLIDIDEVDSTVLQKIERDNPLSLPKEKITVYDFRNRVLFTTDHSHIFKISPIILADIRLNTEVRFRQGEYEMFGILYTSRQEQFVVVSGAIDIYGLKKLNNLRDILLTGFGICIIITFIAGSIYSRRALLPISDVIHHVNNISASSMDLRVNEGNKKDEIARLAGTFNNMLDRLESAFTAQKNFIANASHELRNPLTAISGQLEVLLLQNRSADYYKKNIVSVLDDVKKLNLMADRLLLLMQASAESSKAAFNAIRIDEILWAAKNEITNVNADFKCIIKFDAELNENDLTISGNEQLIRSALVNLLDNGCKFSQDHTTEVHLAVRKGRLTIRFCDKGIGIPSEDLGYIFEPFKRGRNSKHIKGHGIGLSLVGKIIQLHAGTIHIASEMDHGTTISITFPGDSNN